jgi:hypothetical protein
MSTDVSTGATSLLHTTVLASAHAVGFRGEGLVAAAQLGDAVQHEHEVIEGLLHGVLDAWRRQAELVGSDAGDHWLGDPDRCGELRPRIGGGSCGVDCLCGHAEIVRP